MKHYFILYPSKAVGRVSELQDKAKAHYGTKEYEECIGSFDNLPISRRDLPFNASLMLIGASLVAIAQCDSVYMAEGWIEDSTCKACHALAFSHGVDIVYESV